MQAAKPLSQVFLKPGRYHIGGQRFRTLTKADIQNYADSTNRLIHAGYEPPVILEHAKPGSDEGAPRNRRDEAAEKVRNGVGWLKKIDVDANGVASHVLDIRDADVAKKMADGSIKFTSPELRDKFTSGTGETFENVVGHVALTHAPRNIEQTEFAEAPQLSALQFSLGDYVDDEKEKADAENPEVTKTDDAEKVPGDNTADPKIANVLKTLASLGLVLPGDTNQDNLIERLEVSALTKLAADEKAKADEVTDTDEGPLGAVTEDKQPMQFSLSDATDGKLKNKLLAKVIQQNHAANVAALEVSVKKGRITPAFRDELLACTRAQQFSVDGDETPAFTLGDVVKLIDNATLDGMSWNGREASQLSTSEHHDPSFLANGKGVTKEQAKALVDDQAQAAPNVFKPKR